MNTLYFYIAFHRKGQTITLLNAKVSRSDRAKYVITPGQIGKFDDSSKTVGEYVQFCVERLTLSLPASFAEEIDAQAGPMYVLDTTKYFSGEEGESFVTCFVSELPKTPITTMTPDEKLYKMTDLLTSAMSALEEHRDESTLTYIRSELKKM